MTSTTEHYKKLCDDLYLQSEITKLKELPHTDQSLQYLKDLRMYLAQADSHFDKLFSNALELPKYARSSKTEEKIDEYATYRRDAWLHGKFIKSLIDEMNKYPITITQPTRYYTRASIPADPPGPRGAEGAGGANW